MLTALALMSLLLAPSAAQAAQPAPRPQAGQVAASTAVAEHEAQPAPAATPVRIGIIEPAVVLRAAVDTARLPGSAHPRAQGSRAPPA